MRAFLLDAPSKFDVRDVPIPSPKYGEVLVRVAACGICGSDIPRVMETGAYRHPIIPGHEFAGYVESVGEGVDESLIGTAVAVYPLIPCGECEQCANNMLNLCENYDYLGSRSDGGFAEFAAAPASNLVLIPSGVSVEHAALSEPAAVALHGLTRAELRGGENLLVFGAGTVGLLVCQIAKAMRSQNVFVFDVADWKMEVAERNGWAKSVSETEIAKGKLGRIDVIVDAAGAPSIFPMALRAADKRSRILLLGNPHDDVTVERMLLSKLLRSELCIVGSWNSVPEPEWSQVLNWMANGDLIIEPLITHRVNLEELPEAFVKLSSGELRAIKVLAVCSPQLKG
ncbi:MAG: galactitol-1-phosphate 5-dehydrogenase [Armatimonadota bacterium]|nr:galactitol-1-phosphate 5-dehydrogenase [Armatimonadota bacterium]MDW8025813.1 galactitol-1-phosphate 5-dehydrogenase [Armatimonadota bacterium]